MARLIEYLKALYRHGKRLVGIGAAVFYGLPALVEFFIPSVRGFVELSVTFLVAANWIRGVLFFGLVFFATYLAWKEERERSEKLPEDTIEPRLEAIEKEVEALGRRNSGSRIEHVESSTAFDLGALERQIAELKEESDYIKDHSWGWLGSKRKGEIVEALQRIAKASDARRVVVQIFYESFPDCLRLARDIHECFRDARWNATFMDGSDEKNSNRDGLWIKGPPPPHHPYRNLVASALRQILGSDGQFIHEADFVARYNNSITGPFLINISVGPKPRK